MVETVVGKDELYLCELCDMRSNLNNMMIHIIGLKHRLAYLVPRLYFSCNSLYKFLACISVNLCFSCNSLYEFLACVDINVFDGTPCTGF